MAVKAQATKSDKMIGNPASLSSCVMIMECYLTSLSLRVFACVTGTTVLFQGFYEIMHVNDLPG